ncbi:MAG: hypothetical protein ABSH16_12265 [Sedimentisphaerales bacterium]
MKKIDMRTLLCAIAMGLSAVTSANAGLTVFHPTPNDLSELSHAEYFTWGINFTLASDEEITIAALTFNNIWDWTEESTDHLFVHLLDNPKAGTISYIDNQGGGDNFAGKGPLVGDWSDPLGGKPRNFNLVFDFSSLGLLDTLNNFAATTSRKGKANFGFGIDPDCHYYNDGVTFTITAETKPATNVPEPATIVILAIGGLPLCRKR